MTLENFFNAQDTFEFIALSIVLTIIGLLLKQWQPPICRQYQAIILLIAGIMLGKYICTSFVAGFMVAGLVFYKDDLVDEITLIKDSFTDIKELKKYKKNSIEKI